MNKAGLWLHISWFAFLLFCFPLFAFADATFEIPYTLDAEGSVICDIPLSTYNASISFYSYSVIKDDVLVTSGSTGGKRMCQGFFKASTASEGGFFLGAGAGAYHLTLYSESGLRDPYGYMVFDCPEDGVCESTKLTDTKTWYGSLVENTTWTKTGNPHFVDQLTIDPGVTLTMEPGVVVQFRNKASFLYIETGAALNVNGTKDDKVYLTTIKDDSLVGDQGGDGDVYPPSPGSWDNIQNYGVIDAVNLETRYANIGMVNQVGGEIKLDQSIITDTVHQGLLQQAGIAKITNSKITGGDYGIYQVSGSTHLFNSSIYDQSILGVNNTKGDFNAMHNYWGHASGPHLKFSNDPSGSGEDISNDVAYIPWLNEEPTENKYMGCVVDCFSNVMFLPGFEGTRLYENKTDGSIECGLDVLFGGDCFHENELWVSRDSTKHERLSLNESGKSMHDVYTQNDIYKNSLDEAESGLVDDAYSIDIYDTFLKTLHEWKNANLFADYAFIPYDWRLSLEDIITNGQITTQPNNKLSYTKSQSFNDSFILKQLEKLQVSSKNGKVIIIGHSNGGLVAKALVQKLKDMDHPLYSKIEKVILVTSPQAGTPEAAMLLTHGIDLFGGLLMSNERSRQLAENMPGAYNLLPSAPYFDLVQTDKDPIITFEDSPLLSKQLGLYGGAITSAQELKDFVLGGDGRSRPAYEDTRNANIGNKFLYDLSESVHAVIDNWQPHPNTQVVEIAGWGEETLSGFDYVVRKKLLGEEKVTYKLRTVIDGDGTVVVPSAFATRNTSNVEEWYVNLSEYNGNSRFGVDHKDILKIPNLIKLVESKIKNQGFQDEAGIVFENNIILSSDETRLHFTLHSPLTLGIYDSEGRYTGLDPVTMEVRNEIPGVYYEQIGEVQFLSVPAGIKFTLKLDGFEDGSFALDIDEQSGNNITASTIFEGIPSGVDTVATIDVDEEFKVGESVLKIDKENDGTIDVTLTATPDGRTMYEEPKEEVAEEPTEEPVKEVKEEVKEETLPVVISPSTSHSVVPVWMLNQPTSSPSPVVAVSSPSQEPVPEPVVSEPLQTEVFEPEVLGQETQEDVEEVIEATTEDTSEYLERPIETESNTNTIPLTASVGETPGLPYQKLLFVVLSLLGILLGFRFIKR